MATNAYKQLTLVELAKRHDPDGSTATIAEILNEENPILFDAPYLPANDTFSHKTTQRLKLPSGSWRKLNAGVSIEASQTREITDAIGMLETYSEVDKELVKAADNPEEFRMNEATAFVEGLGQTLASTMIYGNSATDPEKFTGLAPRLNDTDDNMVIDGGGSGGDTTSVYCVQWGPTKAHCIVPKNSMAGIQHQDLGEVTLDDGSGNLWQGYRDHFQVKCGLVVRDPRAIGRYANIEVTGTSNIFDEDKLITLLAEFPNDGRGLVIYVSKSILVQAQIALKDKSNVNWSPGGGNGLSGEPIVRFQGFPVRKVDQILETESEVTS